uniref:Uncharacterized protein n=1 Tax=Ananas comosus var. bracteatus TaxID=296719 RepID=A0A6V7P9G4_ANACO|nr:unnamed protein product [Ananas comosus var. bracteatus]
MQILKLTTFAEVFDRALWAEHGNAYAREECESMAESRDKGKKRAAGGARGRSNAKKPPRYLSRPETYTDLVRVGRVEQTPNGQTSTVGLPATRGKVLPVWPSGAYGPGVPEWGVVCTDGGLSSFHPETACGVATAMSAGRSSASCQPEDHEHRCISFIHWCVRHSLKTHGMEILHNPDYWWVNAPEHSFKVHEECLACPVQIGDWIMPADLLVLKQMWDFDVILGIDWLSKYYAVID